MVKIQVITSSNDAFYRQLPDESNEQDRRKCIGKLCKHVEQLTSTHVVKIVINEDQSTFASPALMPVTANICGKLIHETSVNIYNPGVKPYVFKAPNNFGTMHCLLSTACTFHTGYDQTTTLFRGGVNVSEIDAAIKEAFPHSVQDCSVHQTVTTSRLGHPVAPHNNFIAQHLSTKCQCVVTKCLSTDETMFQHAFTLNSFDASFLATFNIAQDAECSVRLNICRTGVMNCFISVKGGLCWSLNPVECLLQFSKALYSAVLQAT
jgi:hypothetical protein